VRGDERSQSHGRIYRDADGIRSLSKAFSRPKDRLTQAIRAQWLYYDGDADVGGASMLRERSLVKKMRLVGVVGWGKPSSLLAPTAT
jgi:hypothetical protein